MRELISQSKREGDGCLLTATWLTGGSLARMGLSVSSADPLTSCPGICSAVCCVLKLHAHGPSCFRQGALFTLGISRKTDPRVEKILQTSARVIGEETINPMSEC